MTQEQKTSECCVVVGIGPGLGRSLARKFAKEGYNIALASRKKESMEPVQKEILNDFKNIKVINVISDVTNEQSIRDGYKKIISSNLGIITVLCYNVGPLVTFPVPSLLDLKMSSVDLSLKTASGAFLWSQLVIPKMISNKFGSLLFTGATGALRGSSKFAHLAMGKFALRALSQSIAREFQSKGIHSVHFIIDGIIKAPKTISWKQNENEFMLPQSIADTYYMIHKQPKNCWVQEMDLRPFVEKW